MWTHPDRWHYAAGYTGKYVQLYRASVPQFIGAQIQILDRRSQPRGTENTLSVEISFDKESAVASISLADWAPPLLKHVGRYFDIREGVLRLDYAHLSAEDLCSVLDYAKLSAEDVNRLLHSLADGRTEREHFVFEFEIAAQRGTLALTLAMLGHGSTGIEESSSILDRDAYRSAEKDFVTDALQANVTALRATIVAEIAPGEVWVSWLFEANSYGRHNLLEDREIMAALVARTPARECIHCLQLVKPRHGGNAWAFDQLVQRHRLSVLDYVEAQVGKASSYSSREVPDLVFSLFANSPTVQECRQACEQVLNRAHPTVFLELIQHCRTIVADDVRSLFLRWRAMGREEKQKSGFKECVAAAFSTLASLVVEAMPSDLALAGAWHGFAVQLSRPSQQGVAASLGELPSGSWDCEVLWSQLGPAAREAWRQDLLDQVKGEPELAQGLIGFACLWLEQTAFAEVEPVLLRLINDEDHLAFAIWLGTAGPRQMQLRARSLVRSMQGALDLDRPEGQSGDAPALPSVGAQTWLGDPSVERVIHQALSRIEGEFCREYSASWGEDEEAHTARLLALTQAAAAEAISQLRQLSATTRVQYPSLSVSVRQPTKREEGARTPAGAPLGADVLFLTRIVDEGKTVIQRATLVQVKKRSGTGSGSGFSSTISIDLRQCEDMLKQSEHAYYLFMTPAAPRPTLWVAPARLIRNLTQLHTSKTSVVAMQVRDASRSYADFFLHDLVGLWAGDEQDGIVAVANGNPRLGRTPRHIVDIEVRRHSN